jgi:hypothetical protein
MPSPKLPAGARVYPVHLDGEPTSRALPTIVDSSALEVGHPIWVRVGPRNDDWRQGVLVRLDGAILHVRLLAAD